MFSLHNNVETAHNRGCHLGGRKVSVFNRLELYCGGLPWLCCFDSDPSFINPCLVLPTQLNRSAIVNC